MAWPREVSRDTPGASAFSEGGLNSKRNPNPEPQRRQQDEDFRQDLLPAANYHYGEMKVSQAFPRMVVHFTTQSKAVAIEGIRHALMAANPSVSSPCVS